MEFFFTGMLILIVSGRLIYEILQYDIDEVSGLNYMMFLLSLVAITVGFCMVLDHVSEVADRVHFYWDLPQNMENCIPIDNDEYYYCPK